MTFDAIVETLRAEALDDRDTGWLSDLSRYDLRYDAKSRVISLSNLGSIDLGHLAEIVERLAHE